MNSSKKPLDRLTWARVATVLAAIWLPALGAHPLPARAGENADDGRGVLHLQFDGMKKRVVLAPAEELKAGQIYSHFSRRLKRRVWSYVQGNGRFWYALGEGTTQEAWRLIQVTQDLKEKLAEDAPDLHQKMKDEGDATIYARLTSDDQWVLAERARFPTVYNAESGYRWEKHSGEYIPVSSVPGRYRWAVHQGSYVPAERLRQAAPGIWPIVPPTTAACNCR